MNLFDRFVEAESTTGTREVLPKGNYSATIEAAVLQEHQEYGKNINWTFRLHGQYEGRKVFSTNYLSVPEDDRKDPIWKLQRNLKGLGLTKDNYPKDEESLLTILEAAVDQNVALEVTRYRTRDGKDKNDAFIIALTDKLSVDEAPQPDDVTF